MSLLDEINKVAKAYSLLKCDDADMITECTKIRHEVYCMEKGWEPSTIGRTETDCYDRSSIHYLVQHRSSGQCVGTYRLILGPELPISAYMPENHILHPTKLSGTPCEVSRFSLYPEHRGSGLTTALMLHVGYVVALIGFGGGYMVMNKALAASVRRLGLKSRRLTDEFLHNGHRAVYYISSVDGIWPVAGQAGFDRAAITKAFSCLDSSGYDSVSTPLCYGVDGFIKPQVI